MSEKIKKKPGVLPWALLALVFFVIIVALSFLRPSDQKQEQSYELTMVDLGFDTPVTFQSVCTEEKFVEYLEIVRERFQKNNALFDQYNAYDGVENVQAVNAEPVGKEIILDPLLAECLETAMKANALVSSFDISQGDLISIWHDFREGEGPLPTEEMIAEAINPLGVQAFSLNGEILIKNEDFSLDLGGIAKGFTVQQAVDELIEAGCTNGYINAGGNVELIGRKPDGEPWKVGIIEPDSDNSLVRFVSEEPTSLVTSGDYQRYMEVDGIRYSHIIDPQTGMPARYFRSVTVINQDSAWADAMSTALYLMDLEQGLSFCKENNLEAVWIAEKGQYSQKPQLQKGEFDIYFTDGLKDNISLVE